LLYTCQNARSGSQIETDVRSKRTDDEADHYRRLELMHRADIQALKETIAYVLGTVNDMQDTLYDLNRANKVF